MNGTRVASDISHINPQQASPCGRFNPYLYARILFSHLFLIYYSHCNIRRNVLKSDKRIFPDKGRDRNFLRRFGRVAEFSVKSQVWGRDEKWSRNGNLPWWNFPRGRFPHDPRAAAISSFGTLSKARGLSPWSSGFPRSLSVTWETRITQRTAPLEFTFHAL